jgi:hypothetical protein
LQNPLDGSAQPISSLATPAVEGLVAPPENLSRLSIFKLFLNKIWLGNAIKVAWLLAPKCIIPALIGEIGCLFTSFGSQAAMAPLMTGENVDITILVQAFFITLLTLVGALVCVVWSFGVWLLRLTTYCHAFSSFTNLEISTPLSKETILARLNEAAKEVASRKVYLAKFYFYVSLFMAIPLLACFVIIFVRLTLSNPAFFHPDVMLHSIGAALTTVAVILAMALLTLSLVAVVVSAVSQQPADKAAVQSTTLTAKMFCELTLVSVFMFLLVTLISSPDILTSFDKAMLVNLSPKPNETPIFIAKSIWQAAASIMLLPLTLAPLCELLRGRVQ